MAGASQLFEGLFDFGELQVELPELRGVGFAHVGAQEVAAFSAPGFTQFAAIKPIGERGGLTFTPPMMRDFDGGEAGVASGVFPGGTDGLMHGVAFHGAFASNDGFEGVEILAQPTTAHGALFLHAILALGEHIGFAFMRQELDVHAGSGLLRVALEKWLFERGEFAFRGADEVTHRRCAAAHLLKHFFGGNASAERSETTGAERR